VFALVDVIRGERAEIVALPVREIPGKKVGPVERLLR
jgi:hypothetical protein